MSAQTTVKERPILFSGAMVRAILEGKKAQTRRVITPQPWWPSEAAPDAISDMCPGFIDGAGVAHRCPYGQPGDRLWVRETWRVGSADRNTIWYRDNGVRVLADAAENLAGKFLGDKWRPSILMFRWASRLTLEVTDVRVERLQDISEADAREEGIPPKYCDGSGCTCEQDVIGEYAELWDALNASRGYGWDVNPFVWVLTFRRLNQENAS